VLADRSGLLARSRRQYRSSRSPPDPPRALERTKPQADGRQDRAGQGERDARREGGAVAPGAAVMPREELARAGRHAGAREHEPQVQLPEPQPRVAVETPGECLPGLVHSRERVEGVAGFACDGRVQLPSLLQLPAALSHLAQQENKQ